MCKIAASVSALAAFLGDQEVNDLQHLTLGGSAIASHTILAVYHQVGHTTDTVVAHFGTRFLDRRAHAKGFPCLLEICCSHSLRNEQSLGIFFGLQVVTLLMNFSESDAVDLVDHTQGFCGEED